MNKDESKKQLQHDKKTKETQKSKVNHEHQNEESMQYVPHDTNFKHHASQPYSYCHRCLQPFESNFPGNKDTSREQGSPFINANPYKGIVSNQPHIKHDFTNDI